MIQATRVVNLNKSPYDVYIGRGSIWGNPYTHKEGTAAEFIVPTREEAIAKYYNYIMAKPELFSRLPELKGKVLGCFCKPKGCHGDILRQLVESHFPSELELQP